MSMLTPSPFLGFSIKLGDVRRLPTLAMQMSIVETKKATGRVNRISSDIHSSLGQTVISKEMCCESICVHFIIVINIPVIVRLEESADSF